MDKKKTIRPLVILLVLAIAVSGWWYSRHQQASDTDRLVLYGNIDIREAYLAFNDSEHIDEILVQEGDHVKKGQLLATLHKARMQAQYAAAEAKVASRKAIVARLEAGSRPEEIRQARADVAAAKARLHDAKLTYERNRKLHQKEAVSRQIVDDAQAVLDEVSDQIWLVSFMDYELGYFDADVARVEPADNPFIPKVLPMWPVKAVQGAFAFRIHVSKYT